MSDKDLKPTVIPEVPFPGANGKGTADTSASGDTLTPTEVNPIDFPKVNIATGLRSFSLDTQAQTISGNFTFTPLGAIRIGTTSSGIKISPLGIIGTHAGVTKFTLSSDGNFVTSGYIQVGGAAGDVNGGVTTIGAGKILISGSTLLSAWSSGSDATYIDGGKLYTGTVTADTVRSNWVYAGNIAASQITSGTITVGGTNQPTALTIQESSLTGNARLGWQHGSRLWEDSSSNMGVNAVGGTMIFYTGSTERFQINSSGMNVSQDITCKGLYLNQGQVEGNIRKVDIIYGYNDLRFGTGDGDSHADYKFLRDNNSDNAVRFEHDTGKIHSYNSVIDLGGTEKTAIVPTSTGYNALYCAEAPEVWLFDFCKKMNKIDPMFLEVTEGEIKFIECVDGTFQVWRRRKGHAGKRFEPKSALQFYRNEAFYQLAK